MIGARAEGFPAKVARECLEAADRLSRLQVAIGDATLGGARCARLDPRLMIEMQALDAVCQTLHDLAALFDGIEDERDPRWAGIPSCVLERVSQTTLRDRLDGGPAARRDPPDIDLF